MIEQQEVLIAGGIVGYLIEQIQLVTVVDDIVIVIPKIKQSIHWRYFKKGEAENLQQYVEECIAFHAFLDNGDEHIGRGAEMQGS